MRGRSPHLALVLGAGLALASCGGVQRGAPKASQDASSKATRGAVSGDAPAAMSEDESMSPASPDGVALSPRDQYKEEIATLFDDIRKYRVREGLTPEPLSTRPAPPVTVETMRERLDAMDPKSEECVSTCEISNNICINADRICEIADGLGGDAWADDKCESATKACGEATEKCEDCTKKELYGGLSEGHIEAPVWN